MNTQVQVLLQAQKDTQQITNFKWRDKRGQFHKPKNMETRHIFYTLRMIWNHSMPEEAKIRPYREYDFNPFYTKEYMQFAVLALAMELSDRYDLSFKSQNQLQFMLDYLSAQHVKRIKL